MIDQMPPVPSHSELIIRSAHLASMMAGEIASAATEAAMLTTDPDSAHLIPALLKGDLFILNGLLSVVKVLDLPVPTGCRETTEATLEVLTLETKTPDKSLLKFMTEPELKTHLNDQLQFIKHCQTKDTLGSMLVIFGDDGICQYGATCDPETTPAALRELADRIERNQTVKR